MADNIAITPGSGTTVATDEVGGAHYQYVKPAFGVDGTATLCSATNPLPVGGSGAAALGKAEDAAHTTGDVGVPALSVRQDAAAALAGTDGDYAFLETDALGKLWVTGTYLEDAAHTSGDKGIMALAVRQDAAAALAGTDADYAPLEVDALGKLWVTGAYLEDAAHTTGDKGIMALAVRQDTAAALAGTDADYIPLITDALGKLWVTGTYLEDAAHTTGDKGIMALAVRKDAVAALAGSDADYAPLEVNALGALYIQEVPNTTGGYSVSRNADTDETEDEVKATGGMVYQITALNDHATTTYYIHLYDAATATDVNPAADTPIWSGKVAGKDSGTDGVQIYDFPMGIPFTNGIKIAATTTFGLGAVGPGANEVQTIVLYK